MMFHVVEQYHTWASGETGVTVYPAQIVERLIVGVDGAKSWIRESEINPSIHMLYDPPKPVHDPAPVRLGPSSTFKPKGNKVLTEVQTSRLVQAEVRPGETRMMTLLPSPTLEPDAKPLTIPYDESLLAWRHHQWPDCKMTDRP